jgi:predicted alpha/beta superfamily hydrolase
MKKNMEVLGKRMIGAFMLCSMILTNCFVNGQSRALLSRTETQLIHSNIVGEDFEIFISLPVDYFQNDTATYAVLYCTDGNRNFGLVSTIVNILSFPGKEIPGLLVVDIGYKITGLEDWGAWRNRDLLPTNDSVVDKNWANSLNRLSGRNDIVSKSGGAQKFLGFIRNELIPYIELNYRVKKNDRALIGYSYGGVFTLFSLFQSPETFQKYYAGSPSILWDHKVLFKYEQEYADTHKDLPVTLFMSVGSLEYKGVIADMYEMANKLESRNYPGLKLETHLFEGETHASCYAAGVSRALRMIYNDHKQ